MSGNRTCPTLPLAAPTIVVRTGYRVAVNAVSIATSVEPVTPPTLEWSECYCCCIVESDIVIQSQYDDGLEFSICRACTHALIIGSTQLKRNVRQQIRARAVYRHLASEARRLMGDDSAADLRPLVEHLVSTGRIVPTSCSGYDPGTTPGACGASCSRRPMT